MKGIGGVGMQLRGEDLAALAQCSVYFEQRTAFDGNQQPERSPVGCLSRKQRARESQYPSGCVELAAEDDETLIAITSCVSHYSDGGREDRTWNDEALHVQKPTG